MAKKPEKRPPGPKESKQASASSSRKGAAAEIRIDAHRITSAMEKAGKVKDERNRRQLAENLGKILAKRKEQLNLSELVVDAGVSENPDPSRLSRFRILPGKELSQTGIRSLNQDPLAYVRLVKSAARMIGEDPAALVQELVVGTKFELSGLENVSIEPFEQILSLIEQKIAAINSKYDLEGYFRKVREQELLPVWNNGPTYNGQIASKVLPKRPEPCGWNWPDKGDDGVAWDLAEREVFPSVPLCRVSNKESFKAKVRINSFKDDDATIYKRKRVFLSIGMITDAVDSSGRSVTDKQPSPYLITVDELWYDIDFFNTSVIALEKETGRSWFSLDYWVAGNLFGYVEPADPAFSFEPHDFEIPNDYWGPEGNWSPWLHNEQLIPLNLPIVRDFAGREEFFCRDGDALEQQQKLGSTLAPRNSLLANMESQLLYGRRTKDKPDVDGAHNFLDLLEADAERLTSSLSSWGGEEKKKVDARHQELLEQYIQEATQVSGKRENNDGKS